MRSNSVWIVNISRRTMLRLPNRPLSKKERCVWARCHAQAGECIKEDCSITVFCLAFIKERCCCCLTGGQSLRVNGCQQLQQQQLNLGFGWSAKHQRSHKWHIRKDSGEHLIHEYKVAPAGMPKAEQRSPKSTNKLETWAAVGWTT